MVAFHYKNCLANLKLFEFTIFSNFNDQIGSREELNVLLNAPTVNTTGLDFLNSVPQSRIVVNSSTTEALRQPPSLTRIFYIPFFRTPHFPHFAPSTLGIFLTPHFSHSASSTFHIFYTPHQFCKRHFFGTPQF